MIRSNLLSTPHPMSRWPRRLVALLAMSVGLHLAWSGWCYRAYRQQMGECQRLSARLDDLARERESLPSANDGQSLAGAIAARNRWLAERDRSPARVLAQLIRHRPDEIRLVRFDASIGAGSLLLHAPDMGAAGQYLNLAFGGKADQIRLESRTPTGMLVHCSWTD